MPMSGPAAVPSGWPGGRHAAAAVLALWVPAFSLSFFPLGNALLRAGFVAAAVAIAVTHLAAAGRPAAVWRHGPWLAAAGLALGWALASVIWAQRAGPALAEGWRAALAVFVAFALIYVMSERRHALWLAAALTAGPILSALSGLVGGDAVERYAGGETFGRLVGGSGDANQLAAGLVPAVALACGLAVAAGRTPLRWVAAAAVPLAVLGIVASQSRGGLLALGVLVVLLVASLRGARAIAVTLLALAALGAVAVLLASPEAVPRLTDVETDGTGREDLWRVAAQMAADHPFGVGLNGFRAEAAAYAMEPGTIERLYQVVDRPVVVHNTYLQLVAEVGLVGLLLFGAVVVGSLRAGLVAARRFASDGDEAMAVLARASVVALLGFLVAATFVSFGFSYRMWSLLALGPVLLSASAAGLRARAA